MHLKNNTEHSSNTDKIKQYKNGVNYKKKQNKTMINIKFWTVATSAWAEKWPVRRL